MMIRGRNRQWALWWAAVLSGAVAACANGTATFRSNRNLKNAAPVTRLVVAESVRGPFFGGDLYRGFLQGLKTRLANCGVTASIEQISALDLDPERRIASAIETLHADAVMLVTADGGEQTGLFGPIKIELRFKLKLLDVTSRKVTWIAESTFSMKTPLTSNDIEPGVRFATSIVSRLRNDGVLASCPNGRWPDEECYERRRKVLAEARLMDPRLRPAKLKTAPICP